MAKPAKKVQSANKVIPITVPKKKQKLITKNKKSGFVSRKIKSGVTVPKEETDPSEEEVIFNNQRRTRRSSSMFSSSSDISDKDVFSPIQSPSVEDHLPDTKKPKKKRGRPKSTENKRALSTDESSSTHNSDSGLNQPYCEKSNANNIDSTNEIIEGNTAEGGEESDKFSSIKLNRRNKKFKHDTPASTSSQFIESQNSTETGSATDSNSPLKNSRKKNVKTSSNKKQKISNDEETENCDKEIIEKDREKQVEEAVVQEDLTNSDNIAKYIEFSNVENVYGLLLLARHQQVALSGYANVVLLHGHIEICGHSINSDGKKETIVFSPYSSSLQYIADVSSEENNESALIKSCLKTFMADFVSSKEQLEPLLESDLSKYFSLVIFKAENSLLVPYIESLMDPMLEDPFKVLIGEVSAYENYEDCSVLSTKNWVHVVSDVKEKIKEQGHAGFTVMVCGGSNVGKSTFVRYSINSLLNDHKEVFYLECDCGQTEFTPPATLSLVKVTKPLLGPPFTHLNRPVRSLFYGHISPKDTPTQYIKVISSLFETYWNKCKAQGPLVINQQGWVKGLGLELLMDCIRVISPSVIIQLSSVNNDRQNLPEELNKEFISTQTGWCVDSHCNNETSDTEIEQYPRTYHFIYQYHDAEQAGRNKSRNTRNLSIMSYFSGLYSEEFDRHLSAGKPIYDWIPSILANMPVYEVGWDEVALHVIHENVDRDVILNALNMTVVSLAKVEEEEIEEENDMKFIKSDTALMEYLGLAILCKIDVDKKLLYLLSPEPEDVMENVNALLRGNLAMPKSYLTQDPSSDHPYYCYDYVTVGTKAASAMKPRFNLKRKQPSSKSKAVD